MILSASLGNSKKSTIQVPGVAPEPQLRARIAQSFATVLRAIAIFCTTFCGKGAEAAFHGIPSRCKPQSVFDHTKIETPATSEQPACYSIQISCGPGLYLPLWYVDPLQPWQACLIGDLPP